MIITFAHYKGGTGKTTSCLSIAGYLFKNNKKVLVVDLDPQGNATSGLGINKKTLSSTMYEVMKSKRRNIRNIILETDSGIHLAPTNHKLELANKLTYRKKSDALILKKVLKKVKDYYDFILIDTPPVHGHFIINGMAAADSVFIVLDPGIFAIEGIETLRESFGRFFATLGLPLKIDAALVTKCPRFYFFRKNHSYEIQREARRLLDRDVFMIPYSDEIYETQVKGIPISHYKPKSKVGKSYKKITNQILRNIEIKQELNKEFKKIK